MSIKRRNYFINAKFQTEFIIKFCGLVAIGCVIFGVVLYMLSSSTLTTSFENSRLIVKSTADYIVPGLILGGIITAILIAIAATIVVILMTHRIAGPIYRFEKYAESVGSGELFSDLKIRKNDQFQNLVTSFNKMTQDLSTGFLKVVDVSTRLDKIIDELLEKSKGDVLLKEDIKKLAGELKQDNHELKKTLSYFKIR